jgi:quinol monooxygenase YgiN
MKKSWLAAVVAIGSLSLSVSALAADMSKSGIYQVSEINILPTAMAHGGTVSTLYRQLIAGLRKEPGLINVEVTQQIGQPYNFSLIEQWQDQASLDAASASSETREFESKLQPLLSGPVYQRVFGVFE